MGRNNKSFKGLRLFISGGQSHDEGLIRSDLVRIILRVRESRTTDVDERVFNTDVIRDVH